ncbi:hypothetical protein I79_016768 [Cricetulus griseus]|uniref:Uncharacterized protein n=1 Tax=Cricetulus griseus TaxID=10029 RepID=G3I091_CRIGR|nr:hypothetical protein I79_016768 [Cricetulus griseus]
MYCLNTNLKQPPESIKARCELLMKHQYRHMSKTGWPRDSSEDLRQLSSISRLHSDVTE